MVTLGQDLHIYHFIQGVAIVTARSIKVSAGKPVLSDHSKLDKMKVLKAGGSLMQVESIVFCDAFDLHLAITNLENIFLSSFEWLLKAGLTMDTTFII